MIEKGDPEAGIAAASAVAFADDWARSGSAPDGPTTWVKHLYVVLRIPSGDGSWRTVKTSASVEVETLGGKLMTSSTRASAESGLWREVPRLISDLRGLDLDSLDEGGK